MSRRGFGSNDGADEDLAVDISPMIDCVFILLIFFIVTTVFVEESGIKVDKPDATTANTLDKNSLILAISAEDQVFFAGDNIGISGIGPAIKPVLMEKNDTPINIQADRNASQGTYFRVHDIVRQAVRDAGGDTDNISLATKPR